MLTKTNDFFVDWKESAKIMNIFAVIFLGILYCLWALNLPGHTTFYEAHLLGLAEPSNYLQIVALFGLANLVAPALHITG